MSSTRRTRPTSALVSGGASGLGAATARLLADRGYRVVILDVDGTGGAAVARDIGGQFVAGDVARTEDVARAVAAARELRVAVNTAGIGPNERVLARSGSHGLDLFERVVRINLIGTFDVLRQAAASMARNEPDERGERGVIVNTASIAAFEPTIGLTAYSASKGGVVALTLAAARDLVTAAIRVATIAPGLFDTPMFQSLPSSTADALAAEAQFPPRTGRPEEFAAMVGHIIDNQMLNGETIRLDGALRMPPGGRTRQ